MRAEDDARRRRPPARAGPRPWSRSRWGRGPENGSSRTSSSGSWTSAAASCTRCWLPWERSSSLDFARSASPNRSSQAPLRVRASRPLRPVVLAEVRELLRHAHPRVQAALLGHVAEAQARLRVDGCAVPADVARVRRGQAEDAAHGGGLAGAVGAEEADQPSAARRERGVVERRDGPVALGEAPDLEHVPPGWHRPRPGLDRPNSTPAGPSGRTIGRSQGEGPMTTPDPVPGAEPTPDDATSAYDPEAAPWPPAGPAPSAAPSAPARLERAAGRRAAGLERAARPPRRRPGTRRRPPHRRPAGPPPSPCARRRPAWSRA